MRSEKIVNFMLLVFVAVCVIGLCVGAIQFLYVTNKHQPITPSPSPTPSLEPILAGTLPPRVCVVTSDALNVRMRPSEDSTAIYWLVQNDTVTILDDQPVGNWVRVQMAEQTGWINTLYCKKGK